MTHKRMRQRELIVALYDAAMSANGMAAHAPDKGCLKETDGTWCKVSSDCETALRAACDASFGPTVGPVVYDRLIRSAGDDFTADDVFRLANDAREEAAEAYDTDPMYDPGFKPPYAKEST